MKAKLSVLVLLALVSGMWMRSEAVCAIQAPEGLYQVFTELSGTLEEVGYPCEDGMDCPDCLTVALITDNNEVYYLTGLSEEQQQMIDKALYGPHNAMWPPMPVKATVSGTPYQGGSFDFIKVLDIVFEKEKLHSLCDMWNVLEIYGDMGPEYETWRTTYYALGEQTTINNKVYYKLFRDGAYAGALREDENGRIYISPSIDQGSEFLIYDFNAQVGDTLKDLYIGNRYFEYGPEILYATVEDIKPTTPRTFVLDIVYIFPDIEDAVHWEIKWIEGIGMTYGPVGNECPLECGGGPGKELLCAYKLGVQVYTSESGEKYGCNYFWSVQQGDTIPLYAQDDPGSSTVDPVDPNQIVATLDDDKLTIRESSGDEITYNLERREANDERKELRGERKAEGVQSDTFHNSVTIQLTEDGVYQLELTNPSWDYIITGTFRYGPQGTENIQTSDVNIQKILRDGRLYIQVGGRIYGITGQQIQ